MGANGMKNGRPVLTEYASNAAMTGQVADQVESVLREAVALQGVSSFAVSGGSTPAALYQTLSKRALGWRKIAVALVDERWVAPGTPGSNESFVRETLLQNAAAAAAFTGMWSDVPSPAEGLATAAARYDAIKAPFDVILLGLGQDGHTASWFPDAAGLEAALSETGPRLAAVKAKKSAVTGDFTDRMTLTLAAVKSARYICMLLVGEEKRATFARALRSGPVDGMPVRAILRARPDMHVAWAP